jgi:hypothetical protein
MNVERVEAGCRMKRKVSTMGMADHAERTTEREALPASLAGEHALDEILGPCRGWRR